jgi:hypothetical protein
MIRIMIRLQRFISVLSPSTMSGSMAIGFAVVSLTMEGGFYVARQHPSHIFLFSSFNPKNDFLTYADIAASLESKLFGNTTLYQVLLFGCAVIAVLLLYGLSSSILALWHKKSTTVSTKQPHATPTSKLYETTTQLALKAAALTGWLVYGTLFFKTLYPLCLILLHSGLRTSSESIISSTSWVYILTASILLALVVHLHVTFLRLVAPRQRLFGANYT